MKLIHKHTRREVHKGDIVKNFRGEQAIVVSWTKPHSPASTGRIIVAVSREIEYNCYPEFYSCEWIEREDRQEEAQTPQPSADGGFGTSAQSRVNSPDQTIPEILDEIEEKLKEIRRLLS